MKRPATILILTAALAAGCGGSDSNDASQTPSDTESPKMQVVGGSSLAADDIAQATMARNSIDTACGFTRDQAGSDVPLGDAVGTLQEIYRSAGPKARIASGFGGQLDEPISVEKLVEDTVAVLRDCDKPAEADELAGVLDEKS